MSDIWEDDPIYSQLFWEMPEVGVFMGDYFNSMLPVRMQCELRRSGLPWN